MSRNSAQSVRWAVWISVFILFGSAAALAGVTAQGVTAQGVTAQGVTAQGVTAQGVTAQGVTAQGVTAQGVTAQGVTAQGVTAQGVTAQGVTAQGVTAQGVTAQGVTAQGASLIGTDLLAADGRAVELTSIKMRGLTRTSGPEDYTLTNIPTMSSGPGNYIAMSGGGGAALHYAVAHTRAADGTAAEDIDLYIASEDKDPMPNLFHRYEEQGNQDELYVVYFFHKWSGQWISLCPYNSATKSASAMALPVEDATDPKRFIFACTATGVASKCARNWGYKPWGQATAWRFSGGVWALDTFDLKPYYDICTAAARAGYCQDDRSYTKNGTLVDLYDTRQIVWPNAIENPFSASNDPDSLWMLAQEYFISQDPSPTNPAIKDSALQRTRYKELSPIGECANMSDIGRLEHSHVEDGRWANPLTSTPRLQVFSPTYCSHNEYEVGESIPWDCSPCTTQVCKTMPGCCGAGLTPGWTATCVGKAISECQDAGTQWPTGKVWPRDLPSDDQSIYPTYLFGPQGAVLRADGTSGASTAATISGWACDPEWPGATVRITVRDQNGVLLGEGRADQALATPLAREVSATCDGPGRSYARHGFSITLPSNQAGDVYVYALDDSSANGPPAPDTLIRNGVVHVPRCAHSEHVAGEALAEGCSACTTQVCTDGSHGDCCSTGWSDDCAAAANACASAGSSALANSHTFTSVTTGWIEPPTDGNYVFEASQQPSRLFVNGTKVLDWFETAPGTTSGSITLKRGQKYHLRWDRFQAEPPAAPGPGVTWQVPGTVGQAAIPSASLYAISPGIGAGLSATYFNTPFFIGASVSRTDTNVDINKDIAPPGPTPLDLPAGYGPSFSAIWEGEIVPSFTEDYTFHVVGSGTANLSINGAAVAFLPAPSSSAPGGCAHDLCALGPKLDASCNGCVSAICADDPFCCDGGYLSYYSLEPEWDARCMAAVQKHCPGYQCAPPPGPGSPQKKTVTQALQAGVHYSIRLTYSNPTADKTIRLLWSSARTAKQAVPQYALNPLAPVAAAAGAGLNVVYFAAGKSGDTFIPDLATALVGGSVPDLSLTPPIGQLGVPLVDVLATPVDASSGRPSPPSVVRPRYGEEVFVDAGLTIHFAGVGGITGGWVRIIGGSGGDVVVPVGPGGAFTADVPTTVGAHVFKLVQQTFAGPICVPPTLCSASDSVAWPLNVTLETASPKAPKIFSPTDPTHSAPAVPTAFNVVGRGTSGVVHVEDQGQMIPVSLPDILANADGTFAGTVTLDPAAPDAPEKGWHKLVFSQGGAPSRAVFVSVGIDPPTVVFPRTGAEIDCEQPDPKGKVFAGGYLPYPESFGRLRVYEETGRQAMQIIGAETAVGQAPPGQPIPFLTNFSLGPGRHVLYFFQAPEPPLQWTPEQKAEHFRAYARLADTPTSRIVIDRKPPRFEVPRGASLPLRPGQPFTFGSSTDCAQVKTEFCAEPNADVNVRIGSRVFTTRASDEGVWRIENMPVPLGWSPVTFAQVLDSKVGGAWSESCESNVAQVGSESFDGPNITVPDDITVDAVGPEGTRVFYDVTAKTVTGEPVAVECLPPSGKFFPPGTTFVRCTATDPRTGAVGLNGFRVNVVDGPPEIKVFDVVAEADQPAGKELASYPIVAFDVVDKDLLLECIPSAPNLFLLDEVTPVVCKVTDHLNQSAIGEFTVKVVDTTPPDPCPLSDILIGTNSGSGAIVNYATCASDIVDGAVPLSCDHPSGSFFPLGKTLVSCNATDKHGNRSATETFTVSVGDTTPPVLKLPKLVTAVATTKNGARVSYTVTATDNVDPNPKVKCTPPSGSQFPLGPTPVTCKATDASGNSSQGTFIVKVIVAWSGLLPPIPQDGSGVFKQGSNIPVKFELVDESEEICDLLARLYIAPVDAAGKVGPEKPAKSRPPGKNNVFAETGDQYHLNMDTSGMAVGRWQLRVDLGDGEPHPTLITIR